MQRQDIKLRSRDGGGTFDCYVAIPDGATKAPGIVIASAVQGVDQDMRDLADAFAAKGVFAAAPDLFWRTIPGPLPHGDARCSERSRPRLPCIKAGEADMMDALAHLKTLPGFNGRAMAAGFCYGGPYAIVGPKRLGFEAGFSCHGSQMGDYLADLDGVSKPVCFIWGDADHQLPPALAQQYRDVTARMKNTELHLFPGIQHAYMIRGNTKAFDQKTYDFSMQRAFAMLDALRG
jgi:carboxymethylenebutenolidase